jgi:peptidoglycan/xylan/chitin deacetylase (PgdA/CDA1 family)
MAKKIVLAVLLAACLSSLCAAENVTFCYHKFSYAMEDIYSILPETFEWQVKYIKDNKIPVIGIDDLIKFYSTKTGPGENVLLTVDDGWKSIQNILPVLDRQQVPAVFYLIAGEIRDGAKEYLTPEELAAVMKDKWAQFGCHSFSHPVLTRLDDAQLKYEVVDSKTKLEEMTGTTLNSFAYPFGILNKSVEKFSKQYYRVIFGVNDGYNDLKSDPYNLNRFVLYRNTTFGEFMDMCSYIKGPDRPMDFTVRDIGQSAEYGKRILFPRVKYYKFRAKGLYNGNVLFIPSSNMGAAWNYKTINKFTGKGTQCGVIVNRNNNIPFYRPEKSTMKVIQNWGMKAYMDDISAAFEYILSKEQKSVIVTWGDGFDQVMAVLGSTDKYNSKIRGIVAINPSFPETDPSGDLYRKNIADYNAKLAAGEHAAENMEYFLKIKTLSDMVVIKPDDVSRFTQKMGYKGTMTNKDLLEAVLNDEDHPDLGIDYSHEEYTLEDFKQAFMQPIPLFSMVVPITYLRDLNQLWLDNFVSEELGTVDARSVALPVSYIYSDSYADAVKKVKSVFTGLKEQSELQLEGISTIEIMLSNNVASFITDESAKMLK